MRKFIFLLILYSISCISSAQSNPNSCRNDNCQNGGTCFVASNLPVTSSCPKNTIFYMGFCYFFDSTLRNWNDAALYCNKMESATLPSIENSDDQAFFAGYLQGIIPQIGPTTSGSTSVRPDGIWTSIRGVNNVTRPSWVSYPGSYLVTETFWASQEPNVYLDYNDVCVALEARSYYREWTTALCEVQKYTVCKILPYSIESRYVGQCVCPSGFGGLNCELQSVSTQESTQTTCGKKDFQFSCAAGQSIIVEFASFGAKETSPCEQASSQTPGSVSQTCSNVNSLQTVINACQGLQSCEIKNLTASFPNTPCPVPQELYLESRLRCQNAETPSCSSPSSQILYDGRCYSLEIETNEKKQRTYTDAERYCTSKVLTREWYEGGQLINNIPDNLLQQIATKSRSETKKTMSYWLKSDSSDSCRQLSVTSTATNYNNVPCDNNSLLANSLCSMIPQSADTISNRPTESAPISVQEQQDRNRQVYTGVQP